MKSDRLVFGLGTVVLGFVAFAGADPEGAAQAPAPGTRDERIIPVRPAGVMYLLQPDSVEHPADKWKPPLAAKQFWTNPAIDGAMVRGHWNKIEPAEGKCDWHYFDEALRLAAEHHKQIGLSVAAGVFTPAWVHDRGAQPLHFMEPFNGKLRPAVMPVPWDPVFLKEWGRMIREMGKRYGERPELAYVTMGGYGRWVEAYFLDAAQDLTQLQAQGGIARWEEGTKRIIDLYAEAFPHRPFLMAMAPPIPGPQGQAAMHQVVRYGIEKHPGHFGLRSDGLSPGMGRARKPGYVPLTIKSLSSQTTVGFQMSLPSDRTKRPLAPSLDNGVLLGAHFIEVYAKDCDDPAFDDLIRQASARLKARR
jgi:hypothetical protein